MRPDAAPPLIDVQPHTVKVLFLKRQAIPPDDFLNDSLQRVWASQSVRDACPERKFPTVSR